MSDTDALMDAGLTPGWAASHIVTVIWLLPCPVKAIPPSGLEMVCAFPSSSGAVLAAILVRPGGYVVIGANESHFCERGFEEALVSMDVADLHMSRVRVYDESSNHGDSLNEVSTFRVPEAN